MVLNNKLGTWNEASNIFYSGTNLPAIYIIKEQSLYGYRKIGNQIDRSMIHYFGLYNNPEKTTP